jgi:16S rRNA processing protein RimM
MNPDPGWLRAGSVGRPHGLDGSFYVHDPKHQLLSEGREVLVRGAPVRIAVRKGSDLRPIIRLEGAEDRDATEALRGEELLVARDDAPSLDEDEWWEEDLEGCRVHAGGRTIGSVKRLLALPSCEALEVTRAGGGGELLVPLVSDAVLAVDLERREIEVDLAFLGEA